MWLPCIARWYYTGLGPDRYYSCNPYQVWTNLASPYKIDSESCICNARAKIPLHGPPTFGTFADVIGEKYNGWIKMKQHCHSPKVKGHP